MNSLQIIYNIFEPVVQVHIPNRWFGTRRNELQTMSKHKVLLISLVALTSLLQSCDLNIGGAKDLEEIPATEILEFTFSPGNVVSVGDTLTITCVIKDSLDSNLRYSWGVGIHAAKYSEENSITFRVKEDEGRVSGVVSVSSPGKDNVIGRFFFNVN